MKVVLFYHSLLSCWNHGNAHFLRGTARELVRLGHEVVVYEPEDGWSRTNALAEGAAPVLREAAALVPGVILRSHCTDTLDLEAATQAADLVIVHEWNPPELIARLGRQRAAGARYTLLFHDTHHRAVTAAGDMDALDLGSYDAVLAFGEVLRQLYLQRGWGRRVFTWHEAADVALFRPLPCDDKDTDLIWIGNWGDEERSRELHTFLLDPALRLRLRTQVYGVRYPAEIRDRFARQGIAYRGWLPNHRAPEAFARARVTVHVPRQAYATTLPGIPTIRVFEALACGIPLVSAPWRDEEGLFPSGTYLTASSEQEMTNALAAILADQGLAAELAAKGLRVIRDRHTCAHRVRELLAILASLRRGEPLARPELAPLSRRPEPGEPGSPKTQGGFGAAPGASPLCRRGPAAPRGCRAMRIAFFGSSLVSSYWNGAATYYRGLIKALAALGHDVTFYEPDAFERQQHRDIADPSWARVAVYPATADGWQSALAEAARSCDLLVKASGIGVFDAELEIAVPDACTRDTACIYWDVDAPATLDAIDANPAHHLRRAIPRYQMVLTYGGGDPVVAAYNRLGARLCVPIYNALDPDIHHPAAPAPELGCDLGFLGNRLPDREARVEEFFLKPAALLPQRRFVLGGSGWQDKAVPANVRCIGHVGTAAHNAFFCSGLATLNINRESMVRYGFSPPTRVFEASGAGACLITDAWVGIERFLTPGREVLVAADGESVAEILGRLTPPLACEIAAAARRRILAHHTYAQRAQQVHALLQGTTRSTGELHSARSADSVGSLPTQPGLAPVAHDESASRASPTCGWGGLGREVESLATAMPISGTPSPNPSAQGGGESTRAWSQVGVNLTATSSRSEAA